MKKQSYWKYCLVRVEFAIAVALFMEFDYEVKLVSDWSVIDHITIWDEIKTQVIKLRPNPAVEFEVDPKQFDMCFETMKYAKEFRTSPVNIANRIAPYIESFDFVERVDITGGYLNIFFDRSNYFRIVL